MSFQGNCIVVVLVFAPTFKVLLFQLTLAAVASFLDLFAYGCLRNAICFSTHVFVAAGEHLLRGGLFCRVT